MSGLEALSLVCSIMQVISFTKELVTTCKDIYDGRATADNITQENTASIKMLLDNMRQNSESAQQSIQGQKDLHEIARKCSSAAQELETEIQLITQYHKPGNVVKSFIGGIKSFTRKRKVKELSEKIHKYQNTLETHILVRVCTKADALQIQQQSKFIELSETMQHFISQIAAGHTEMVYLINRDGIQTRQQIQQSEAHVTDSINAIHAETGMEAKRTRLLQSLKFEAMNARRTGIQIANEATYVSFFKSPELEKEPTSESTAAAWADFVNWLQSDKQAFWIQGKPGAGKSTLVKFLLQHENTPKALDKWNKNSLIVSHFFWKPGEILQRNLKGLLCSLNHQLLSNESSLINQILSEFEFTKEKDSIGDWEIPQLMAVFKYTLTNYKRAIFFLIDGVDEAVDIKEILNFLTSSAALRNTKWCISSRGEVIFQQAFSKCDGFKLHEYTRDDMLDFARKEIQSTLKSIQEYENMYTERFLWKLRYTLVDKAEGVYLWLVLALESIKRGLQYNDKEDVIMSRLIKLPTGLQELYADMWDRLGDDKDIYQREAAHYFSLLIIHRTVVEEYCEIVKRDYSSFSWFLTPFQIMLAQDDELQRKLLNKSYELQLSELEKKCSRMTKTISIKTAGLLTTHTPFDYFQPNLQVKKKFYPLRKHVLSQVEFIHRTLFDFLTDTEPGRKILAQARSDLVYVHLVTIILCQLRIIKKTKKSPLSPGGILHYYRWLLNQARKHDIFSNERISKTVLPAFETLFEAGLIPWDQRPKNYPRPHFDVLLLDEPGFRTFIKQRLESKGASYATCVFREFMFTTYSIFTHHGPCLDVVKFFGDLGADINSAGACFYEPPVSVGQFAGCFTYESTLSFFLKGLYAPELQMRRFPNFWASEPLRYLVAFLERSPNLDMHTSFILTLREGIHHDCFWNLCSLLSTIARDNDENNENNENLIDIDEASDKGHFGAAIIIEVNLKYLVEQFLRIFASEVANPRMARIQQLAQLESSKAYIKPRFIVTSITGEHYKLGTRLWTCYRFTNEDIDGFPTHDSIKELDIKRGVNAEKMATYIGLCERVDVSALTTLLHEKLGACLEEF